MILYKKKRFLICICPIPSKYVTNKFSSWYFSCVCGDGLMAFRKIIHVYHIPEDTLKSVHRTE